MKSVTLKSNFYALCLKYIIDVPWLRLAALPSTSWHSQSQRRKTWDLELGGVSL